jgi:single-strand DNA-binding protein
MSGETSITVVGNLTDDPELRFTTGGHAVAKFRVASTPSRFDKQQQKFVDLEPLFLSCSAWRDMAEHVANSLTRGARVIVQGRLRMRSYETREGEKRTVIELEVDEIGPSLRYATAAVQKMQRNSSGGPSAAPPSGSAEDPWATAEPAPAGNNRTASAVLGQPGATSTDEPPF